MTTTILPAATVGDCAVLACDEYRLTYSDMCDKSRYDEKSDAKRMYAWLCRTATDASFEDIARYFGKAGHAGLCSSSRIGAAMVKTKREPFYGTALRLLNELAQERSVPDRARELLK